MALDAPAAAPPAAPSAGRGKSAPAPTAAEPPDIARQDTLRPRVLQREIKALESALSLQPNVQQVLVGDSWISLLDAQRHIREFFARVSPELRDQYRLDSLQLQNRSDLQKLAKVVQKITGAPPLIPISDQVEELETQSIPKNLQELVADADRKRAEQEAVVQTARAAVSKFKTADQLSIADMVQLAQRRAETLRTQAISTRRHLRDLDAMNSETARSAVSKIQAAIPLGKTAAGQDIPYLRNLKTIARFQLDRAHAAGLISHEALQQYRAQVDSQASALVSRELTSLTKRIAEVVEKRALSRRKPPTGKWTKKAAISAFREARRQTPVADALLRELPKQHRRIVVATILGEVSATTPTIAAHVGQLKQDKDLAAATDQSASTDVREQLQKLGAVLPRGLSRPGVLDRFVSQLSGVRPSLRARILARFRLAPELADLLSTISRQLPAAAARTNILTPIASFVEPMAATWRNAQIASRPLRAVGQAFGALERGVGSTAGAVTSPVRSLGGWIGSKTWEPLRAWAGAKVQQTGVRLAAWGAKQVAGKGLKALAGKAALWLGMKLGGTLLAQAVPVVGQIYGIAQIALTAGQITVGLGKRLGDGIRHFFSDPVGFLKENGPLLAMLTAPLWLGYFLLSKLVGAVLSAAPAVIGGIIGGSIGAIFGPLGAVVGATLGTMAGAAFSAAGGVGGVLAAIGTAASSAVSAIGSFLTGLSATISGTISALLTVGVLGGLAAAMTATLVVLSAINAAMVAPSDSLSRLPNPGPGAAIPACWPTSGQISQGPPGVPPSCSENDVQIPCSHAIYREQAVDIASPTHVVGEPAYATHDGTAIAFTSDPLDGYGNYVLVQSPQGFSTVYAHLLEVSSTIPTTGGVAITGGTEVGLMGDTGNSSAPHLHYELKNDGGINDIVPEYNLYDLVTYDPACIGQGQGNLVTGWVASASIQSTIATRNSEFQATGQQGQNACDWMSGHPDVTIATNANFWGYVGTNKSPRGAASYNNDPIPHSMDPSYDLWSLVVDNGVPSLTPAGATVGAHGLAVSGTPLLVRDGTPVPIPDSTDGAQNFIWHTQDTRIGIGFSGNQITVIVLNNATVQDLQQAFVSKSVSNAVNLDGGSSATLCQRTGSGISRIITQGRESVNSIGLIGGSLAPYTAGSP